MQGMSIAPVMPGAAVQTASPDGAVTGDEAGGGGAGGLFGAILAGQIKGKAAAKANIEAALLFNAPAGGKGDPSVKEDAEAGVSLVSLAELLAASGMMIVPSGGGQLREAGKGEGVTLENLALEGGLAAAMVEVAIKDGAVKGTKRSADAPVSLADEGAAAKAGKVGEAGEAKFADGGKLLPALGQAADELANKHAASDGKAGLALRLDEIAGGAASAPSMVAPVVAPPAPAVMGAHPADRAAAMNIAVPVASPSWGDALGNKMVWMSSQGSQVAELRLDPPHLGPLEVRLTVANDQASAVFVSHHAAVREAIEAAMPRLREMLAESGIMLGNAMVGAESFAQQQSMAQGSNGGGSRDAMPGEGEELEALSLDVPSATAASGKGMVDTFV